MADEPKDRDALTPEQFAKSLAWVNAKAPQLKCPVCGNTEFNIASHLVYSPIWSRRGVMLGGKTYPHVLVYCGNCAHALTFNAILAGVIAKDEPKPAAEAKESEAKSEPPPVTGEQ